MKGTLKKTWVWYTRRLGRTILHPQYITNSYQYEAIVAAKRKSRKSMRLVDIGCGRMPYRREIEPLIKEYIGVDHPEVSKLYQSEYAPEVLADAHELPFKTNSFDMALMLQMIEYLKDPPQAIQECYRILKKNGIVIVTVPFLYAMHDIPYDRGRYTKSMLLDWFKSAGFSRVSIESQGVFIEVWLQMLTVWLFKTIERLVSKKDMVMSKLTLIILILLTPGIVLLSNSVVFIFRQLIPPQDRSSEYFPLNYLVIAVK
ncbi:MAG: class I SAM-dependent methyltransferase [Candidatus Roizmanbacteria bacterium]|nr:class I SAM-dependent methyltransferase [Candidatus Roizmanbacteria bacterium]